MTRRKPPGMSFETWVDRQITSAQERGAFRDLPGSGRPLSSRHLEQSSYEWALEWARREDAGSGELVAGMLPPGMALRRERDLLPAAASRLTSEAEVRALGEDYNRRVEQFWRRPQFTPDAVPGLADVDALVTRWHATRPEPEPEPAAAPVRRRRWWWRRTG